MNDPANSHGIAAARVPPKLMATPAGGRVWIAAALLTVLGAGVVLFCFDPAKVRLFPACFFHLTTGWHCPGCGGTRAMHQLLHGNLQAAFHLNALLVLSLPLMGWQLTAVVAGRFRQAPGVPSLSAQWLWLFLALAVAFGVLRNLPAFAWLAP